MPVFGNTGIFRPGRHYHQTVAPGYRRLDDGLLSRAELLITEGVFKHPSASLSVLMTAAVATLLPANHKKHRRYFRRTRRFCPALQDIVQHDTDAEAGLAEVIVD